MKQWPTPTASEDAAGRPGAKMQKMLGNHPDVRGDCTGGALNPPWVEWLMGWPIGWTALESLEIADYPNPHEWTEDPADSGTIPRVAHGVKARGARLKAIGNGQVPAAASLAWSVLGDRVAEKVPSVATSGQTEGE